MAVTAIWDIKGRVDQVIRYAANPEKTTGKGLEVMAALHAVEDVPLLVSYRSFLPIEKRGQDHSRPRLSGEFVLSDTGIGQTLPPQYEWWGPPHIRLPGPPSTCTFRRAIPWETR